MSEDSMTLTLGDQKSTSAEKVVTNISRLEMILVFAGFFGLGILLAIVAGGPIYTDELWYLQLGLNNVKDPFYLNRYTHVFLQKLFIELAPSVLAGAKAYWSFAITLTGLLIYYGPRLLSKNNHILHSLLAAGLYFSFPFYKEYSGVTIIDFTAMLMVALIVTLYILSYRHNHQHPGMLFLIGFIFLLAFKTKESTLAAGVVLVGLGFKDGVLFDIGFFARNLLKVIIGFIAGMAFFILISGVILGDPWFGLTRSSLQGFYYSYIETGQFLVLPNNWYTDFILPILPLAFLLYLVSGMKTDRQITPALRLIWLIPLVLVVGLVMTMLKSNWGVFPRYFYPALPVLAILAPQFLRYELPAEKKDRLRLTIGLGALLLVLAILGAGGIFLAYRSGFEYGPFLSSIVYPIAFSLILGTVLLIDRFTTRTVWIPVVAILAMLIQPIGSNFYSVVIQRPNQIRVQERFYPFSTFEGQIKVSPDMKMYVSSAIPEKLNMLDRDRNALMSIFNIHFRAGVENSAFTYSQSQSTILDDLVTNQFDYVLLTDQDWQAISTSETYTLMLGQNYTAVHDQRQSLVLLRRNNY
jgi:hypothetical protein